MGRARKRHLQLEMRPFSKPLDKRQQLRGSKRGEKRVGVGRPKKGERASERHKQRERMRPSDVAHVVMRVHPDVGSLRRPELFHAIREALITVARHEDTFRVVQFSVQSTHLHFFVEAADEVALANGMQSFGISAAKHINKCLRGDDGRRRRGSVFPDRYHVRLVRKPRDARNTLAYILNNWRHHGADRRSKSPFDPYSSGILFDGWRERAHAGGCFLRPPGYLITPLVWEPKTWLARIGWQKRGLISAFEVPGGHE